MLNLNGILTVNQIHELNRYTSLRLRDSTKYKSAEALCLYEQKMLPNEKILELCEEATGEKLFLPVSSYIPNDIIKHFENSDIVPVAYSPASKKIICVALKEIGTKYNILRDYTVEWYYTPIYNYFYEYIKRYGRHNDLLEMPARQLFDSIVNEGIALEASDLTISSTGQAARVYYNVRKRLVMSQRILTGSNLEDIIKYLCFESPMDNLSRKPKSVGVSLNDEYRGRVEINHKYKGYEITIRFLPNAAFDKSLEDCNLTKETIRFMREYMMNRELGLRLVVGSTMSGKNTTCLAMLKEIVDSNPCKVVSIEMPVEQELYNVEQISCDNEEEYDANISSLLRQNPDFVYLVEIGDTNANAVMRVGNTGKKLLSTLHANSVSDVFGRLMDITGLSTDRLIQVMHSIIDQELVRDEENDTLSPKVRYLYLSRERKTTLYGLPYGEVIRKVQEWEGGDIW